MTSVGQKRGEGVRRLQLRCVERSQLRRSSSIRIDFVQTFKWAARSVAEDDEALRTPRRSDDRCGHVADILRNSTRSLDFPQFPDVYIADVAAIRRPEWES